MENTIKTYIIPPHKGSEEDYTKKVWKVHFEYPNFSENKFVYITEMDLRYKKKIDTRDLEYIQNYLKNWVKEYLKGKKFQDIENEQGI